MGYTTDFQGEFTFDQPLTPEQRAYLTAFANTRRMKRDPVKAVLRPDPIRKAVGLGVGPEGAYFVGEGGFKGQGESFLEGGSDVLDYNHEPEGQPGLWCQWVPSSDGTALGWDGGEKFYNYVEWIVYLIQHFIAPWGRKLNGEVEWQGEDSDDRGKIEIVDNEVRVYSGETRYVLRDTFSTP